MKNIALVFLEDYNSFDFHKEFFEEIERYFEIHLFQNVELESFYPEYPLQYLETLKENSDEEIYSAIFVSDIKDFTIFCYNYFYELFSNFCWIVKKEDKFTFSNKIGYEFYNFLSSADKKIDEESCFNGKKCINVVINNDARKRWLTSYVYDIIEYNYINDYYDLTKSLHEVDFDSVYSKKYFYNGQNYYIENDNVEIKRKIYLVDGEKVTKDFLYMNKYNADKFIDFIKKYGIISNIDYAKIFYNTKENISDFPNVINFFENDKILEKKERYKILICLYSINLCYENVKKISSLIVSDCFNLFEKRFIYWQLNYYMFAKEENISSDEY
ncbi:MAG: hypothetical protein ACTTKD_00400, partial [Peptoanaerobacter stomatis]